MSSLVRISVASPRSARCFHPLGDFGGFGNGLSASSISDILSNLASCRPAETSDAFEIYLVWTLINCQANSDSGVPRLSSAKACSARAKNSRRARSLFGQYLRLTAWTYSLARRSGSSRSSRRMWEDVWWLQVWQFHSGSLLVLQELGAALLDE